MQFPSTTLTDGASSAVLSRRSVVARPVIGSIALSISMLTTLLAGCGGGGGGNDQPEAAPAATEGQATVDAAGGTVQGPDQVSLSIAPDSVATATTFRIARDSSQSPPLVGMTLLTPIYAVTPHGSAFDPHALLKLPYDASKLPAGAMAVVLRGEPDGTWHVQPNRGTQVGVAVADVSELSWYAVGVCTPGDAGVFGFGIGDCPANHSLKLEYLDGKGGVFQVVRDAQGRALPFLPVIDQPTDIPLRLTWTRPAGVDRVDSLQLTGPYQAVVAGRPLIGEDVNQALTTRNAMGHIDPTLVAGARDPKGTIVRYKALAEYCWTGFIIGRGDNQRVCWRFDDDIAFRVRDTAPDPDKPIITVQPVNLSVVEGNKASFHVDASGLVKDHSLIRWLRRSAPDKPWALAYDVAKPVPGVTLSADGKTLTLTAHQAQDNGTVIRPEVCNIRPSGAEGCADGVDEAQLTVTSINGPATWTGPSDQSVPEHSTIDMLMTATGIPYPTVEIWQLKNGVDTLLKTCTPAKVTLSSTNGKLPPNPTVCSLHLPDPALHPADLLLADSGTQFYGKAIADTQAPVISRHATLTVTNVALAPAIVTQPVAAQVSPGDSAGFNVSAKGSASLSYQWWFQAPAQAGQSSPPPAKLTDRAAVTSGSPISGIQGSGSPSLALSNIQPADAGRYYVVVSNGTKPDATSDTAALTVVSKSASLPLAVGGAHACVIKPDSSVACWGDSVTSPVAVPGLSGVAALFAYGGPTCAIKSDGSVVCWSPVSSTTQPVAVPALSGVVALAMGYHTCGLKADGTVACFGPNNHGQLGDGSTTDKADPVTVPGLTDVVEIAAGANHTCARKSDGTVMCWGEGDFGEIGDGGNTDKLTPTAVLGLSKVKAISAGGAHTCAIKADDTVVCWGALQLNSGKGYQQNKPFAITGLTGVLALAAGDYSDCAVKAGATVVCWGGNEYGQLGDGTTVDKSGPVAVPGLSGITRVDVGNLHACAAKADGSVWCWGANYRGQLGDGTTADKHSPTPVAF